MCNRVFFIPVFAALSTFAVAQGTGLAAAPLMKTLGEKEFLIEYRQTSKGEALDSAYVKNLQFIYGAYKGLEFSYDTDLDGLNRLSFKYAYQVPSVKGLYITGGAFDFADDPIGFIGGAYNLPENVDVHVGYIDRVKGQAFVGVRKSFVNGNTKLRLFLDHTTGPAGQTGFRSDYFFDKHWSVDFRLFFPNNSSSPRRHRFGIAYGYQF